MIPRYLPALLLVAALSGCTVLSPFATNPPPLEPGVVETDLRVAICYNPAKTPPEKVQELGQAQCFGDSVAQQTGTDYLLQDCPVLTPKRATFVCRSKSPPKPASSLPTAPSAPTPASIPTPVPPPALPTK
ncbi:MAG TPA: hypothetical protein VNV38_16600 [Stellaceae bacterium]|jgi:hypothetical protein|nr:hypothetical protein [Stellaceae bacterium]